MNIILLGPPGSGKGTQTANIAKEYCLCVISLGAMLREEATKDTPHGKEIKNILAKGELVPIETTTKIIKKKLQKENCTKGILFDGFPRTLEQAEALEDIASIDYVFELAISDDEVIKRLSNRTQCKKGHIYGPTIPSKKQGICDIDGFPLAQREDDTQEAIEERLVIYHDETEPLIEYYKPRNIVHTIDASKKPDKVFADIKKILNL